MSAPTPKCRTCGHSVHDHALPGYPDYRKTSPNCRYADFPKGPCRCREYVPEGGPA